MQRGEIDVARFEPLMAEALVAYATDVSYAVSMVRQARSILSKRATWRARTELQAAEVRAIELCSYQPTFTCSVTEPCGLGRCRWATGELAGVRLASEPGKRVRPQPHTHGSTYSIELGVRELVRLREQARPLT